MFSDTIDEEISATTVMTPLQEVDEATITPEESEFEATTRSSFPDEDITTLAPTTEDGPTCSRNGIEYKEGEEVPVISSCQENCVCSNTTIKCQMIACAPPPPAFRNCVERTLRSDQCCPEYNCRK